MKKFTAITLALVMILALAACGQQAAPATQAPAAAAPATEEAPVAESSPADAYPQNPVNVIVPFSAGGGQTVMARAIESALDMPQPMVISNVEGGGGSTGAMEVLNSKADGYTVLCSTIENIAAGKVNGAYADPDAYSKFTKVCSVAGEKMMVIASKASGFTCIQDVIDYATAHPGEVSFVGATNKSYTHAVIGKLIKDLGIDAYFVPYDGESNARTAVMGGHEDVCVFGVSASSVAIDSGDCVPLCVLSSERSAYYPDVPTINEELGFNYDFTIYRCYVMPPETDQAVADKLADYIKAAVETEEFKESCDSMFLEISFMDSATLESTINRRVDDCVEMYANFE